MDEAFYSVNRYWINSDSTQGLAYETIGGDSKIIYTSNNGDYVRYKDYEDLLKAYDKLKYKDKFINEVR